ncbi:hypothetical protein ACIBFB_13130 [Nocardiopsis sp. NPDC050513]|uniref:hypothetical protein n=1 Tax=Nocardiopsis sp. NPDC050513 TaxID=3364338 RepID=UPI0037B2B8C6
MNVGILEEIDDQDLAGRSAAADEPVVTGYACAPSFVLCPQISIVICPTTDAYPCPT